MLNRRKLLLGALAAPAIVAFPTLMRPSHGFVKIARIVTVSVSLKPLPPFPPPYGSREELVRAVEKTCGLAPPTSRDYAETVGDIMIANWRRLAPVWDELPWAPPNGVLLGKFTLTPGQIYRGSR